MMNRVMAVIAAVGGKVLLSIFVNNYVKSYLHKLNSRYCSPHRLERNCIIEVIIDLVMLEFKNLIDECRDALGTSLVSVTTDFWTNPD